MTLLRLSILAASGLLATSAHALDRQSLTLDQVTQSGLFDRNVQLRFAPEDSDEDHVHVSSYQQYQGVKIWGSDVVVTTSGLA